MGAKRVSFCGYLCLLLSLSLLIVDLIRRHHAPKMKITCNSKNVFISSGACTKTISHLLLTTTIRRVQEAYQDKIKTTCTKARAKCICSRLAQVTLNCVLQRIKLSNAHDHTNDRQAINTKSVLSSCYEWEQNNFMDAACEEIVRKFIVYHFIVNPALVI